MATLLDQVKEKVKLKAHYGNWIDGKMVAPLDGEYFDVSSPVTGQVYTKAARSKAADTLDTMFPTADTAAAS